MSKVRAYHPQTSKSEENAPTDRRAMLRPVTHTRPLCRRLNEGVSRLPAGPGGRCHGAGRSFVTDRYAISRELSLTAAAPARSELPLGRAGDSQGRTLCCRRV